MNSLLKKIIKVLLISVFYYSIISSYLIDGLGWSYFEKFLKTEKHLGYDNRGHKFGWYGPNGHLNYKASSFADGGIFRKYKVTFLDEKGNKIEYSAFEMFGIFIDLSKN